jgi:DNA-binding MarR family transcriptional regulator
MAKATKFTDAPHARIYTDWISRPAWRTLTPLAVSVLVYILTQYRPATNPFVCWSVRQLGEQVGCSKSAAAEALELLEDRGWLVAVKRGRRGTRAATTYRLTMFPNPEDGSPASMDFKRWEPLLG